MYYLKSHYGILIQVFTPTSFYFTLMHTWLLTFVNMAYLLRLKQYSRVLSHYASYSASSASIKTTLEIIRPCVRCQHLRERAGWYLISVTFWSDRLRLWSSSRPKQKTYRIFSVFGDYSYLLERNTFDLCWSVYWFVIVTPPPPFFFWGTVISNLNDSKLDAIKD